MSLYNKIMESVAKEVKQALNEEDVLEPKKQIVTGEAYIVLCSGMNKELLNSLSKKLGQFDNYGAGSIRVICKTHEEVVKTIALLVNSNVLDTDNSLGVSPKIQVQKVSKTSMNDSVNESSDKLNIQRQYIQPSKIIFPRQKAKLELIMKINSGEIERTEENIKKFFAESGLWADRTPAQTQMDVNMVLRRTVKSDVEGDFLTDFIYSPYNYDAGEFASPMDAARNHVKWLIKHGLDVRVEEGRYSFKIYIHYNSQEQYDDLVKWFAWHRGESDSPNNRCPRSAKAKIEELIKSGKSTTWR